MNEQKKVSKRKKILFLLLRIGVSFGLIGYFLFSLAKDQGGLSVALEKFTGAFSSASSEWLVPAFLLHIVGFSLISLRWKILLVPQGARAHFFQLLRFYFMAAFFNTILPSTIGGDAVRAVESRKLTGKTGVSVMVVIIERLTGMIALVLIAATALILKLSRQDEQSLVTWGFVVLILGAVILLAICAHPRIAPFFLKLTAKILPTKLQDFLETAQQAAAIYYHKPGALLGALGVSTLFQFSMVIYYYFIARALQQHPDPVDFLFKAPILVFLLMTVPAVNGIGVRTYVFTHLMGFPPAVALSGEFIDLGIKYIYALAGGGVYLLTAHRSSHIAPPGSVTSDEQTLTNE